MLNDPNTTDASVNQVPANQPCVQSKVSPPFPGKVASGGWDN